MEEKSGGEDLMGDLKFNLIDLDLQPFADVAVELLNKIEKVAGWVSTPKGTKKDMQEAIECYINEIKGNDSLSPLIKAALISEARKNIREYCNVNDIMGIAIENISSKAIPESIDDSWIMDFVDKSKNICNDDLKIIWGKLLACECEDSGSVPKRLLFILSIIDLETAQKFKNVCNFIVKGQKGIFPLLIGTGLYLAPICEENGLDHLTIAILESIGLLQSEREKGVMFGIDSNVLYYDDRKFIVNNIDKGDCLGVTYLTKSGVALANILETQPIKGYAEFIKDTFIKRNYDVQVRNI